LASALPGAAYVVAQAGVIATDAMPGWRVTVRFDDAAGWQVGSRGFNNGNVTAGSFQPVDVAERAMGAGLSGLGAALRRGRNAGKPGFPPAPERRR
jgi:hypothetical protein